MNEVAKTTDDAEFQEMLGTALDQMRRGEGVDVTPNQIRARVSRQVPANAYIRTGLGELPLSARLRDSMRMLNEVLLPMIDNFERLSPQPLLCSVCGRNFGGWPQRILEDHWNQHTWLQRKLAGVGIR